MDKTLFKVRMELEGTASLLSLAEELLQEIADEQCSKRYVKADHWALDCFEARRTPCFPCRARKYFKEK